MDVRTLCLGILSLCDASGYEIKKLFEDGPFSEFLDASYGSIYPSLTRLTEDGLVSFQTMEQDGRPDKKVYSITANGRIAFMSALDEDPSEDRYRSEFLFYLVFSHLMSANRVAQLIDARIETYKNKMRTISDMLETADTPGARFLAGHSKAVIEAAIRYLEENRHLVEGEAMLGQSASVGHHLEHRQSSERAVGRTGS